MYFETDPNVLAWFERALACDNPGVRRRAVALLGEVTCSRAPGWLERALGDPDPRVAKTAAVLRERPAERAAQDACIELMESDLADELSGGDLRWEWEYRVLVCDGLYIPNTPQLAWMAHEDDAAARRVALMRARPPGPGEHEAVAVIVSKWLVNTYTRSPRGFNEAMRWHLEGRPRYPG